ncbi:MAG: cyclopropane fatty acyl phospholipid synthase [Rectinemataceae bacterium]
MPRLAGEGVDMETAERIAAEILEAADIKVNGDRPWDLRVHDAAFYRRVLGGGSLALGESYMDGWWECDRPDELVARILSSHLQEKVRSSPRALLLWIRAVLLNTQRKSRAYNIGKRHYDLGNDLYRLMLDKGMNYSCGYWKRAKSLDDAQEDKLELICRKIGLEKGMRLLDIGCGWGGFAEYAASKYGARVLGITVSREQIEPSRERCRGLPVEIRLQDYRDLDERFDRIVSVGMIEHVGSKNYRGFMRVAARCLAPGGLFLLHTIGAKVSCRTTDPWVDKYIFPDSMLPSLRQLTEAAEGLFKTEDLHSFGQYYDTTLLAWDRNFRANWDRIKDRYGERFFRMWRFYLLSSAGSFRALHNQLWQIVLSPLESTKIYESIRD